MTDLPKWVGFEWDEHNAGKIWDKHHVSLQEAERVFFNKPLWIKEDEEHSKHEKRFHALGCTNEGRRLFIAFTVREDFIRIISARPMSKKERKVYASGKKEDT